MSTHYIYIATQPETLWDLFPAVYQKENGQHCLGFSDEPRAFFVKDDDYQSKFRIPMFTLPWNYRMIT